MEKEQNLNLVITCKFSVLAQAWTGLTDDRDSIIEELYMGDYIWDRGALEPVSRQKVCQLWDNDDFVEIRFECICTQQWLINFTVTGGEELEGGVYDVAELLHTIINLTVK